MLWVIEQNFYLPLLFLGSEVCKFWYVVEVQNKCD